MRRRVRVGAKARARIRNGGPTSVHRKAAPTRADRLRLWAYIRARDQGRCWWCGEVSSQMDVHHVVKRSQGGPDDPANMLLLCHWTCHAQTDAAYSSTSGRLVIKALGEERFVGAVVNAPNKQDGQARAAELLRMAEQALQG